MNDSDLQNVKDLFKLYQTHSDGWRKEKDEADIRFRNELKESLDEITKRFEALPCRERAVQTIVHEKEHDRLWDWGIKLLWSFGIIPIWGAIVYIIDKLHRK
jgi:hypothetical protein